MTPDPGSLLPVALQAAATAAVRLRPVGRQARSYC